MRKLLMSLLMAGSLLAGGIGAALADDASAPAAASAPRRYDGQRTGCRRSFGTGSGRVRTGRHRSLRT